MWRSHCTFMREFKHEFNEERYAPMESPLHYLISIKLVIINMLSLNKYSFLLSSDIPVIENNS